MAIDSESDIKFTWIVKCLTAVINHRFIDNMFTFLIKSCIEENDHVLIIWQYTIA